jgi:heme/copper-type cytochrome/quinol oxidase subunit 2
LEGKEEMQTILILTTIFVGVIVIGVLVMFIVGLIRAGRKKNIVNEILKSERKNGKSTARGKF